MLIVKARKRERLSHGGPSTWEANSTLGFPKDFVVRAGKQGDFTKTQQRPPALRVSTAGCKLVS